MGGQEPLEKSPDRPSSRQPVWLPLGGLFRLPVTSSSTSRIAAAATVDDSGISAGGFFIPRACVESAHVYGSVFCNRPYIPGFPSFGCVLFRAGHLAVRWRRRNSVRPLSASRQPQYLRPILVCRTLAGTRNGRRPRTPGRLLPLPVEGLAERLG